MTLKQQGVRGALSHMLSSGLWKAEALTMQAEAAGGEECAVTHAQLWFVKGENAHHAG